MGKESGPRVSALRPNAVATQAVLLAAAAFAVAGCGPSPQEMAARQRETLAHYCFDCHDDAERTADLSLQSLQRGGRQFAGRAAAVPALEVVLAD